MSTPPGSEEPTRSLPPARPPLRHREVVQLEPEELLWRQEVRDRLRSLTTAVTLVALVAVAGLGVALWVLFADPQDDRGASVARVGSLEDRVGKLESGLERSASRDALATVREQQRSLDQRLQALEAKVQQPSEDLNRMRDSLVETQQALDELAQRVEDLEQQQTTVP
jgi:septal ring factor EnvC (AmiA/AmiB activator)